MPIPKTIADTSHRPYPLAKGPWLMSMRWDDLLFAHWPIEPAKLAPLLPQPLELDTFDGRAWLGVVPFTMSRIRPRFIPPLPGPLTWRFHEINLRTYAVHRGRRGVYFFSLDAADLFGVIMARWLFHLPYFPARINLTRDGDTVRYDSERTRWGAEAVFQGSYRPVSEPFTAEAGSLDHFLTERYCLFAPRRGGGLIRGEIHHLPWPLQAAEAELTINAMHQQTGLELPDDSPHLRFARSLEVIAWPAVRVA